MSPAFLIGLAVVVLAAFALALLPPSRVGAAAVLIRYAAAGFLIATGVLLLVAKSILPALVLMGAGGFVFMRQRGRRSMPGPSLEERAGGPMSIDEAYDVLGLQIGATEEEIRRAHRDLIQKIHPDHGGTSYLAMKLNQARDTLLNRPR